MAAALGRSTVSGAHRHRSPPSLPPRHPRASVHRRNPPERKSNWRRAGIAMCLPPLARRATAGRSPEAKLAT
eukprot:scaffold8637_cov127-Isochrysis_galbana.AAC.9